MSNFEGIILAKADYLSSKLGPITSLIENMADRLVPQRAAKAGCYGTVLCSTWCDPDPYCGSPKRLIQYWSITYEGCTTASGCDEGCGC